MTDHEKLIEWRVWFRRFAVEDIQRALADPKEQLQVGLIILSLLHTEALSGYFAGTGADRNTFAAFVRRYFPATYQPHVKALYRLRNGLAHDYIPRGFVLSGKRGERHLQPPDDSHPDLIVINRVAIAEDFVRVWENYSLDIETDAELQQKALARIASQGFMVVGQLQ